jgi:uncharacterized Zn finger protein
VGTRRRGKVDPVTRESADAKARRYLAEGRLSVLEVGPGIVRATCRGDGQLYRLGWWRGRWGCTCPAGGTFRAACNHVKALRLVVVEPTEREPLTPARMLAEQAEASRVRNGRRSA